MLFLRANRSLPTELLLFANFESGSRRWSSPEKETQFVQELENWLLPSTHTHLDAPRRPQVICEPRRGSDQLNQWKLAVTFLLFRSRSGEKERFLNDLCELAPRRARGGIVSCGRLGGDRLAACQLVGSRARARSLVLDGADLLTWLATWAHGTRLELAGQPPACSSMARSRSSSPILKPSRAT